MTAPLVLFFGLINIPMWGYYNVYTAAQADLVASDAPLVCYKRDKKKKVKGEFKKARASKVLDAIDKWEANNKDGENGKVRFDIGSYLNK